MFEKIIAIIMSVVSVFTAPFSQIFSGVELKNELSKGNYESPYISRPLEKITINGISIDEFSINAYDFPIYENAAQTFADEVYEMSGQKLKSESDKFIYVAELLDSDPVFTLAVRGDSVSVMGSSSIGISRGITAFFDEVVANAQGSFNFEDGYIYTRTFTDFVTYEDFGAVGDGVTDDSDAIVSTHEYANANGLSVSLVQRSIQICQRLLSVFHTHGCRKMEKLIVIVLQCIKQPFRITLFIAHNQQT